MSRRKSGQRGPLASRMSTWRGAALMVRQDADDLAELVASLDKAAGFGLARPEVADLVAVLRASADSLDEAVDRAEHLRREPDRAASRRKARA